MNAIASRGDTVLVGSKPRTRLTEEEIMRAAIAVILVALVTVIAVAAGAIFTIG
jgi:predicted nicotinamide N-methyase